MLRLRQLGFLLTKLLLFVGILVVGGPRRIVAEEPPGKQADRIDYRRDIHPILSARCYGCHGPKKQESGLRLDNRERFLAGGDGGAVIKLGNSAASVLIERVTSDDKSLRMPPDGKPLSSKQIELLRAWIDQGAKGLPANSAADSYLRHWAFQPIRRSKPPAVENAGWIRNAVDRFVLAKLERKGIKPSVEAPRTTLIRRLYLDLIGLPPNWERVQNFINDERPDAYERLVDELFSSPHYGERWGRHWLDAARYADSTGYESDQPRQIWAYRDWVIDALNRDLPFDQFVIEQIAGDLLPDATLAQRIATGFHCNAMFDGGVRWESIIDRVNTTGTVFLGLTVGCSQCHAHKTDPISHREFYQLYAFFNEATISPMVLETGTPPGKDDKRPVSLVMKQAPQLTHIFERGDHAQPGDQVSPAFPAFLTSSPKPSRSTDKVAEKDRQAESTARLNRLDLARWLVSLDNPLTSRVTVNRVWQRFFGLGLVETEGDFGMQTPPPSHPELLDFLASEFRSNGSSLKQLQRLIVTSATYRQSSNTRLDLKENDPRNRLLARQRRLRLESEIIRDVTLAASGLLSRKMGGPSVFPYQPEGILDSRATPAKWEVSQGEDRLRRGLYTWIWRLTPHPHLPLFDSPDGVTACTRRDRSNVPIQALTSLNDPTFVEAARAMGQRVVNARLNADRDRIAFLFRQSLSRDPQTKEQQLLESLLKKQRAELSTNAADVNQIVGNTGKTDFDPRELAVWIIVSRVILNLDEMITRE